MKAEKSYRCLKFFCYSLQTNTKLDDSLCLQFQKNILEIRKGKQYYIVM